MNNEKEIEIYVYLLDEGVETWCPVKAILIKENIYKITSKNQDPEDKKWQFSIEDFVRCNKKQFSGGKEGLVAVEKVDPIV